MSQWAGLMAPPMSVLWHTVVSSRSDGKLYICPVFIWWNSLGTTLVTGSLLLVAPIRHLAALGACRIVLRLTRVSADLLLCAVDGVSRIVFVNRLVTIMATGSGRPNADRPDSDLPVLVHVPWSTLTNHMTWTQSVSRMCWACVPGSRMRRWLR